jgi:choline dehydrogenase
VVSEAFDIVIVGGGAAGCVLARRLAERGDRSVLLLEAGPDLGAEPPPALRDGWGLPSGPSWPYDWGFESEPDATGASGKLRRGRLLGGTSWLTRFAVRGAAADFDAWAARGNPGWGFEDVLPTFRAIEADAEFGDGPWHGGDGPIPISRYPGHERSDIHDAALGALASLGFETVGDHNEPAAIGAGPMPMSTRDGDRVTTLDAYLPRTMDLPSLTIRSETPVASVVVNGAHARAVRLLDGTEIAAGRVVLSAGVYGSAPILLRSGIGPADQLRALGIGVRIDLPGVGENLSDHPAVDLDSGWRGARKAGPILHSIATFRSSMAEPGGSPDLMFWLTDPDGDDPRFSLDPVLLKPHSRGTVRLRSTNPADPPRITLPGVGEAADIERLVEGYQRGLELANRPEIRRLASASAPTEPATRDELRRRVVEGAYSIPHIVGTCRMGPSAEAGDVVDAMGSVHGVEGLSVIDASIIPDAPSGFPHLITIMVAEHLAKRAFEDESVSP